MPSRRKPARGGGKNKQGSGSRLDDAFRCDLCGKQLNSAGQLREHRDSRPCQKEQRKQRANAGAGAGSGGHSANKKRKAPSIQKHLLRCDGSATTNPGAAGFGGLLYAITERQRPPLRRLVEYSEQLTGMCTSNMAEYEGLYHGLLVAAGQGVTNLRVEMDSELVVKQMTGEYACRDARLQLLKGKCLTASSAFSEFAIVHIGREMNTHSDTLAKAAAKGAEKAYKLRKKALWSAVANFGAADPGLIIEQLASLARDGWLPARFSTCPLKIHENHQGWSILHELVDRGHLQLLDRFVRWGRDIHSRA